MLSFLIIFCNIIQAYYKVDNKKILFTSCYQTTIFSINIQTVPPQNTPILRKEETVLIVIIYIDKR